jgi:hypothetical protein
LKEIPLLNSNPIITSQVPNSVGKRGRRKKVAIADTKIQEERENEE